MRRVVPFLLLLAVSACGTTMRWDKPGATDETLAADMMSCRSAAQQEANRYYPFGYYPFAYYGWGHRSSVFWMTRAEDERFFTENRLAAFCMRTKGYEQVEVRKPQTQPPPPSPEPPLPTK
jgi:hypothetical protein